MKLTVTVLGAGGWGANWTERALRDPDVEVRAIADSNPDVLRRLARRGIPDNRLFSDPLEALDAESTDAITCSVPNPHRIPLLERALAEERHILVDKPVVHTTGALRSLLEKACNRRTVFMVAQNYRNFAGVKAMKERLDQGLGPVACMHVHFLRSPAHLRHSFVKDLSGAVPLAMEMGIHHLDMMRYLLGTEPDMIEAHGWRTPTSPGAGFDALDVHLVFPGGVRVAYDADWGAAYDATDWPGHWEVVAAGGSLSYGRTRRSLAVYGTDGEPVLDDPGPDGDADTKRSMDAVWTEFVQAIDPSYRHAGGARADFCPLEDNARSLAMALAVVRSAESGTPVEYGGIRDEIGLSA